MKKLTKKRTLMLVLVVIAFTSVYYLVSINKNEANYELQLKCSQSAGEYFEDLKSEKVGLVRSSYKNHYNTTFDMCILVTYFEWNEGSHVNVYNSLERKQLMWMTTLGVKNECLYLENDNSFKSKCNYNDFNTKLEKYLSE